MSSGALVPSGSGLVPDKKTTGNSSLDSSLWIPHPSKSKKADNNSKKVVFYFLILLVLSFLGIFAGMMSWLGTP